MGRARLLFGISIFWLALGMLLDGLNTLVLPHNLLGFTDEASRATTLGLLTFAGLLRAVGMRSVSGAIVAWFPSPC